MLVGEVKPVSMMRRPGSPWSLLRRAAHPPEWRGTLGPVKPGLLAEEPLFCFFSNQRLSTLESPLGQTDECLRTRCAAGLSGGDASVSRFYGGTGGKIHFTAEYGVVFNGQAMRLDVAFNGTS